jgi:hypothetical protein
MNVRQRSAAVLLAVVLALGLASASLAPVSAASKPTATATATPTPTQTARVVIVVASPIPSPSPSPTPDPTPVIGNGSVGPGTSDNGCAGGIHIVTIFGQPVCMDTGGLLGAVGTAAHDAMSSVSMAAYTAADAAVLTQLAGSEDLTDASRWGELIAMQQRAVTLESDAFAVVLVLGILMIIWPLFFGDGRQGVSLFWHAVFAEIAVNALLPLLHIVALLSSGLGERLVGPGLAADTLTAALHGIINPPVFAIGGLLLVIAGIERSIALYAQEFLFVVAPLMILCAVYPGTRRNAIQWMAAYANLALLGPAFGIAVRLFLITVSATGGNTITIIGGFFFIDLVPAILAALLVVEVRGIGHGFADNAANAAKTAAMAA